MCKSAGAACLLGLALRHCSARRSPTPGSCCSRAVDRLSMPRPPRHPHRHRAPWVPFPPLDKIMLCYVIDRLPGMQSRCQVDPPPCGNSTCRGEMRSASVTALALHRLGSGECGDSDTGTQYHTQETSLTQARMCVIIATPSPSRTFRTFSTREPRLPRHIAQVASVDDSQALKSPAMTERRFLRAVQCFSL